MIPSKRSRTSPEKEDFTDIGKIEFDGGIFGNF